MVFHQRLYEHMCIDIVEIWFGIANEQISTVFAICPRHDNDGVLSFHVFILFYLFIYFFYIFYFFLSIICYIIYHLSADTCMNNLTVFPLPLSDNY